jgi:hypothetical protein
MSTTPCFDAGCYAALAEIDCVSGISGGKGPTPVRVYLTDEKGGRQILREGQACGARYIGQRDVKDGMEQFMSIELKPKESGVLFFEASLTILGKKNGEVVASGGTACGAVRRGEVAKQDGSWVMRAY